MNEYNRLLNEVKSKGHRYQITQDPEARREAREEYQKAKREYNEKVREMNTNWP